MSSSDEDKKPKAKARGDKKKQNAGEDTKPKAKARTAEEDTKPKATARGGKKKKPSWVTSDARKLIVQDMIDGIVPIDEAIVDTEHLYNELYAGNPYFADFPYIHDRFSGKSGRFASLQVIVQRHKDRAKRDTEAYAHDMAIMKAKGPPTTVNNKGQPLWKDSEADYWLEVDMLAEKHLTMDPIQLRATRECYSLFDPVRFAKRIDQKKQEAKEFSHRPKQKAHADIHNRREMSRGRILDPYVNEKGEKYNGSLQG